MDIEIARTNMLKQQIRSNGVLNEAVLAVFDRLPRELFVPLEYRNMAYADATIPLAHEQCMLSPQLEAAILQQVNIQAQDKVLEIGTGTGYLTAVMANLAAHVTSVEIFDDLAEGAAQQLAKAGVSNISLHTGNAATGWGKHQFDVIIVTGALPVLAPSLLAQLAPGGRLFAVIGAAPAMQACLVTRASADALLTQPLFETQLPFLIDAPHPETFKF